MPLAMLLLIVIVTWSGSVQLVNKSSEELEEDYAKIRELEFNGLFDLM